MIPLETLLLWGALGLLLHHVAWYLVSLILRRMDVADVAWGTGIGLIGLSYLWVSPSTSVLLQLVQIALLLWSVRLSLHVAHRALRKKEEDARYAAWRKEWAGTMWWRSFLQVFVLQGALAWVVALPFAVFAAQGMDPSLTWFVPGAVLFVIGAFFEWEADRELARFIALGKPSGLLDTGLWRYSRHPNYFGEVMQWWGLWLMTVVSPLSLFGALAPLLVSYVILFVSGIPMLEARKKDDARYQEYVRRTSVFVPWFPKSRS